MFNSLRGAATAALLGATSLAALGAANVASARQFDHVFVIFEENHGFDQVIGQSPDVEVGAAEVDTYPTPATPFTTKLALENGLATMYFGTTHPSLPNYISLVGGTLIAKDVNGKNVRINTDDSSCFANDLATQGPACYQLTGGNLADQLEAAKLTWADYQQSYNPKNPLQSRVPESGGTKLYAQKHNPFLYFPSIAKDPVRIAAHIRTLAAGGKIDPTFQAHLNDASLENFVFIVPDQCHDAHGTGPCELGDYSGSPQDLKTLKEADNYLKTYVEAIQASKAWSEKSVIFVTWDENDYSADLVCCGASGVGGSHVAMIAVTPNGTPLRDAEPHNHYSLLATIEDNFGLSRLGAAANVDNLHAILPGGEIAGLARTKH